MRDFASISMPNIKIIPAKGKDRPGTRPPRRTRYVALKRAVILAVRASDGSPWQPMHTHRTRRRRGGCLLSGLITPSIVGITVSVCILCATGT